MSHRELLDLDVLKEAAEKRGIKKEGSGWAICCPPQGCKADIIRSICAADGDAAALEEMTIPHLKGLAERLDIKKEGESWTTLCGGDSKAHIVDAIRDAASKHKQVHLNAAGSGSGSGGSGSTSDPREMTVPALKELAEKLGVKRHGVSWPACCPPSGCRDDLVRAIQRAQHSGSTSSRT